MLEHQPQTHPSTPRSESRIPMSLFEAMSRWYFGGSVEKEPPLARGADTMVTVSDAWIGVLCLSYFGNGPRHPSVGFSGGLAETGGHDLPSRETVAKYAPVKESVRMIPGGYAARKAQANNGNRPNQTDQGSAVAGPSDRPARGPGDVPPVVPPSDMAGGPVLHDGGPAV